MSNSKKKDQHAADAPEGGVAAAPSNGVNGTHAAAPDTSEATGQSVTIKVGGGGKKARPKAPEATSEQRATLDELAAFGQNRDTSAEVTVSRVGPREYLGVPVQTAYCGVLPAGTTRIADEITQRWGGGTYRCVTRRPDGTQLEVMIPLAGRPLPIDPQAQRDAEDMAAARLNGYAPASFGAGLAGFPPAAAPASYFQPAYTATPDVLERLKAENEELRRKIDQRALDGKIDALAAKIEAGATKGGGGLDTFMVQWLKSQELAMQQREAADRREAEERRSRADREAAAAREEADRRHQAMIAAQTQNMTLLTSVLSTMGNLFATAGKKGGLAEQLGDIAALKGLLVDDSTAAQADRVIQSSERAIVNAITTLRGGAPALPGGGAAAANPPAASTPQGQAQVMAKIVDFLLGAFKKGNNPRDTVALLIGYCQGAGIPVGEIVEGFGEISHREVVELLAGVVKEEKDEARKASMEECRAAIATPKGQAWYTEFVRVLKAAS